MNHQNIIMHIDMDSFFASVETRDRPDLKNKPVVVCSKTYSLDPKTPKGVVSAASYAARSFGVYSAMPFAQALKLCPDLIFFPMNKDLYHEVSRSVMNILEKNASIVQKASIDEAYVNPGDRAETYEEARLLALKIKEEIFNKERITCSVGIAPNRTVAKVASGFQKPNGLTIIEPENVSDFLNPLPVNKLPGVGKKTNALFQKAGIETIGTLAAYDPRRLFEKVGKTGLSFQKAAQGIDNELVVETEDPVSVSRTHTFEKPTSKTDEINEGILKSARAVYQILIQNGYFYKTVTLSLKYEDYTSVTHSKSHPIYTADWNVFEKTACDLYSSCKTGKNVRRVSAGVSNLKKTDRQQMTLSDFKS